MKPMNLAQAALARSSLNQTELSRKIGVRRATVSDWVTGKFQPHARHARMLRVLADADYMRAELQDAIDEVGAENALAILRKAARAQKRAS